MKAFVGIFFFLVALLLSTFLAKPIYQDLLEKDLMEKVSGVLSKHGLDPSGVEIENHHLTKIGEMPADEAAREELLSELDGIIGLYLDLDVVAAPVLLPPHFRLTEQADQSVILTGLIRDEGERSHLVSLAATPVVKGGAARRVIDQLELSEEVAGIGPREKLSPLAPALLAAADKAFVDWSPSTLSIGGLVDSAEQEAALLASTAGLLPEGESPTSKLQVQAYQDLDFGLERKDGLIIVRGLLPDSEARERLLKMVSLEAKDAQVVDKTTLALRPREGWWFSSPEGFIPAFLSSTKGAAHFHYFPHRFVSDGVFLEEAGLAAIQEKIAQFPEEVKRETRLEIVKVSASVEGTPQPMADTGKAPAPDPASSTKPALSPAVEPLRASASDPAAAEALIKNLQGRAVYFGSSSSYIKKAEEKKIDEVARLILASKSVTQNLTVGGYADLRGNAKYNRSLSLERANAVRDRLIKKGILAERLTVQHFGQDSSETSKKDLWKSRRVEISLTKVADQ